MFEKSHLPWSVFDNLPEPVLVINAARVIVASNRAASALFQGAVAGNDLALAIRQPQVLAAADRALAGQVPGAVELTLTGPGQRTFEVRAAPAPDEGAMRVVITLHDITEMRRAQGMRSDFVANVSHELRSPLAALMGFIETLQGPARDDEAARDRFLVIMQSEAGRMARLIDDLLSLSRVEVDEHIQPKTPVIVRDVLSRVADMARQRAEDKAVRLVMDIPDGLDAVAGDSDQLIQVFLNVIDNAIKYGPTHQQVRIEARSHPVPGTGVPGVQVCVIDQGEGIAEEDILRITERFYRVDKARSRALGGTGLGLAIVKHIVGRHRGRLVVSSEVGRGSAFCVYLPTVLS